MNEQYLGVNGQMVTVGGKAIKMPQGVGGRDGVTFTPSVSEDGDLSWTNDGGLANPQTVNLKGPKGDTGERGPAGADGAKGVAGAPGKDGAKGDKGDTGPRGPQGERGIQGETGPAGVDGKTPMKGTDYFTPTDVNEIAAEAAKKVNISNKLDKPANDAASKAGQLLTKTADGQEWKDREKSTFIVTISGVYGQTFTADKTFLEIQEAYDAGKVCFALYTEIVLPLIAFDREIGVGFGQKMDRGLFYSFLIGADDTITLNVYEAQNKITASGLLKGDGKGGVSAAVAGTDYVTPDGMNSAVAEAKPFIVTFTYNGDYHADKTFEEIKAAYDAGKMCYANFLGNICLRGVFSNSYVTFIAFNVQGSSESIATSMGFIRIYSDNSIVVNGIQNQPFITATGLLKGDGSGGISSATPGEDYIASGNIVKQTLVATETTPTEDYAINWVYG